MAVRRRERREVPELQHRGHGDVRPHARVGVEAPDGDGGEDDDRGDERDRRRGLRVPLAAEQEVPECVEEGRAERENEGVERHGATLDIYAPGRMRAARALVFDFNGTLSHDEPVLFAMYSELFAEHGRPLTEADYYGTCG